jgi:hypothetical protein
MFQNLPWNSVRFHGIPWGSVRFHEVPQDSVRFHGIPWGSVGFHEVPWDSMGFHEILWCFCKPKCTHWGQQKSNLSHFMRFCRVLWGAMEFYDVLWDSMGFHEVLQCFCEPKCTHWGQQRSNLLQFGHVITFAFSLSSVWLLTLTATSLDNTRRESKLLQVSNSKKVALPTLIASCSLLLFPTISLLFTGAY